MEKEIILRRKKNSLLEEFVGEITYEMDKFLLFENEEQREQIKDIYSTYIVVHSEENNKTTLCFRVPGSTRGYIELDSDNRIKKIEFYEDQCFGRLKCYKREIVDYITNRYMGYKISFEK